MKYIIIFIVLFSSCKTSKWIVQPGTLEVKNGKCQFIPNGESRPLKDTVINNAYRLKKI